MAMSRISKYGVRELLRTFPNNKACLHFIFDASHGRRCSCGGVYSLRNGRKSFRCGRCKNEIAPLRGTLFEKSSTPLLLWFHALLLFSNAKSGISAKEIERNLGVTYKCSWRMLNRIRSRLFQGLRKLSGIVETDGAYLSGKERAGEMWKRRGQIMLKKTVAHAAIERKGEVRAKILSNVKSGPTTDFIVSHVEKRGTRLMTDKSMTYIPVDKLYNTEWVNHRQKEYVRGDVHVNSAEAFWAHVKRSLRGTYKNVSKKHLQSYLDAYVFHYNNANNDRKRFEILVRLVLSA
jgi:transposase-like protein